jgi:hypothetical protein
MKTMENRGEPSDNWYFAKGPYKEAYLSLSFSGSLGKNHQVMFDH